MLSITRMITHTRFCILLMDYLTLLQYNSDGNNKKKSQRSAIRMQDWIDSVKYLWISVERPGKTFLLYKTFFWYQKTWDKNRPSLPCIFNLNISKESKTYIYLILMFWNWPKSEHEIFIFTLWIFYIGNTYRFLLLYQPKQLLSKLKCKKKDEVIHSQLSLLTTQLDN